MTALQAAAPQNSANQEPGLLTRLGGHVQEFMRPMLTPIAAALAAVAILASANELQAATTITNPFPNLNGSTSLQSNQSISVTSLTGNKETATSGLISSSAIQVTFGINVENFGSGVDVTNWGGLGLMLFKNETDLLNQTNSTILGIPLSSINYLNGSPIQFFSDPNGTTFLTNDNYGQALGGLTNHILTTTISDPNVVSFFGSLTEGQDFYAALYKPNLTFGDGGLLNVVYAGGDKSFNSPGAGFLTEIPGFSTALHIAPSVPEPERAVLILVGLLALATRRNRE